MQTSTDILQSQKHLHDFFMQAPIPMVILLGSDHVFYMANPLYEKLARRKVVGKKVSEVYSIEEIGVVLPILDNVFLTGEPFEGKEIRFVLTDENGDTRELFNNLKYSPLRDSDGTIKGIIATVEDVTEAVHSRKEVEIRETVLNETLARFRTIADAMPQMVWSTLPDGFHDYYNQQWFDFTGMTPGSTDGDAWNGMFHPDDQARAWKLWSHSLNTGEPYEIEYRLRHKSGEYKWTLGRALPIRNDEGEIIRWMGTCTDIQELRATKDELSDTVKELKEEKDLRSKFIATLTHDLRTPLTYAKINIQLLILQNADNKELLSLANTTLEGINRTDKMITKLLDVSRLRAGEKLPLIRVKSDLSELVRVSVSELVAIYDVPVILKGDPSIVGKWDKESIRRLVDNLITNAIKYGEKNKPINILLTSDDEKVTLSVHNEGHPIASEDQSDIFNPYKRTLSANANKSGWGLGLALVKGVAEAYGGGVVLESEAGSGTTFIVTLKKEI